MPTPRIIRRDDAVLVVVDIQERLAVAMPRREEVVAATLKLAKVAECLGWPVIVTRQYPRGLGDVVPELAGLPADVVDKTAFCCLAEPRFEAALERAGRTQLVLTGMETHICVIQTALAAVAGGIETFVVADACCSRRSMDHDTALDRMRAEGVVVTTSESVIYEAAHEAATDEFRLLLGIVKGG